MDKVKAVKAQLRLQQWAECICECRVNKLHILPAIVRIRISLIISMNSVILYE